MVSKRYLHYAWKKLRAVSYWYFLGLAIIFAVLSVSALRDNNLQMIRLRDAVVEADKQDGDVETALRDLREHVYAHMNTNLVASDSSIRPPIQLKYRYERLLAAETERVRQANMQIVTKAQVECENRFPTGPSISGRVPCVQQYIEANGVVAQPISEDLYKFDFISPRWSPDLAGWSMVLSGLFLLLFLLSLVLERWMTYQLKHHL